MAQPTSSTLRRLALVPGLLPAAACSSLAVGLLALRLDPSGSALLRGLSWNLFLAWIPYVLALLARALVTRGRASAPVLLGVAVAWLLTLPNAPYLLTDLVHLRPRPGVPLWFDAALLALFAAAGWLLGLLSLEVWMAEVRARLGRRAAWGVLLAVCVLCGYGVYLGRVERWNSWDVLRAPRALAEDVAGHLRAPGAYPGLLEMTALFAVLLLTSYASFARLRAEAARG
jgi:uncharacterized membrane protein